MLVETFCLHTYTQLSVARALVLVLRGNLSLPVVLEVWVRIRVSTRARPVQSAQTRVHIYAPKESPPDLRTCPSMW